jgi:hypothetical protein
LKSGFHVLAENTHYFLQLKFFDARQNIPTGHRIEPFIKTASLATTGADGTYKTKKNK